MNVHKRMTLAAAVLALGAGFAAPTMAQEATPWPELMRMADPNNDGMVTKKEFLDAMAAMWDKKHAQMMKADSTMKAGMMDMKQFRAFLKSAVVDPYNIGG